MRLVDPDDWLDGLMDRYEITRSGRLRRQMKKYKLVRTPKQSPGLYLKATKAWWMSVPDADGDVVIYTADATPGTRGYRWTEFGIRFTDGGFTESRIGHALVPRGQEGPPGAVPGRRSHGTGNVTASHRST